MCSPQRFIYHITISQLCSNDIKTISAIISQESTISSNDVLSVFQYKTLTAIYYIEMVINIIPTLNQL